MTALSRLRTAPHEQAAIAAYCECVTDYRAITARRIREDWLLQECSTIVKRINLIRAKLTYAVEERLCPFTLNRQLGIETAALESHRAELAKLRSEQ